MMAKRMVDTMTTANPVASFQLAVKTSCRVSVTDFRGLGGGCFEGSYSSAVFQPSFANASSAS
jgi:hypothetical protein